MMGEYVWINTATFNWNREIFFICGHQAMPILLEISNVNLNKVFSATGDLY
jgi:hypothetical protein